MIEEKIEGDTAARDLLKGDINIEDISEGSAVSVTGDATVYNVQLSQDKIPEVDINEALDLLEQLPLDEIPDPSSLPAGSR